MGLIETIVNWDIYLGYRADMDCYSYYPKKTESIIYGDLSV